MSTTYDNSSMSMHVSCHDATVSNGGWVKDKTIGQYFLLRGGALTCLAEGKTVRLVGNFF